MEPVLDFEKTLGSLNFLGVDEKYKYENGERTNETVYAYKLGSKAQGEQIVVKTPNKVELDYLQECELVNPECKLVTVLKLMILKRQVDCLLNQINKFGDIYGLLYC